MNMAATYSPPAICGTVTFGRQLAVYLLCSVWKEVTLFFQNENEGIYKIKKPFRINWKAFLNEYGSYLLSSRHWRDSTFGHESRLWKLICINSGNIQHKKASQFPERLFKWIWQLPTLPHFCAVPSAMRGLTSLFGMGRGEHPRQNHHKTVCRV